MRLVHRQEERRDICGWFSHPLWKYTHSKAQISRTEGFARTYLCIGMLDKQKKARHFPNTSFSYFQFAFVTCKLSFGFFNQLNLQIFTLRCLIVQCFSLNYIISCKLKGHFLKTDINFLMCTYFFLHLKLAKSIFKSQKCHVYCVKTLNENA